ncbi:MAG: hypothetical protein ACREEM_47360 [Blastocatellia bacterium]
MKTNDFRRACVRSFLSLFFLAGVVLAQDTVRVTATFQNLNVAFQNLPGGNLSVDFKLAEIGKWRLGAVGDFSFHDDTNDLLNRIQLLGGASVARSLGEDRVSVFGRALFGNTRFDSTAMRNFDRVTVGVGGGLDVNFGRFFIRPVNVDFQWIDERPVRYTRLGAGAGFRF